MSLYKIPQKDEIIAWANSEEGHHVYKTLNGIDLARHGFDEGFRWGLSSLYYDEKVSKKSPQEQYEWLKEQMPIKEIFHAAYIPEIDKMLLSDEDEWLTKRSCLDDRLDRIDITGRGYHYVVGTIATVKSNRWRIFDILHIYRLESEDLQSSKEGLARRGYILLYQDREKEQYIPILPEE